MSGLADPTIPSGAGDSPKEADGSGPVPDSQPADPSPVIRVLGGMRDHLAHLEQLCGAEVVQAEARLKPMWMRASEGERRLPVAAAIAVAIALQIGLPSRLTFHPTWLLPLLECVLLIGLTAANPKRIDKESRALRTASLVLIAVITIDNVYSAVRLIQGLINGTMGSDATVLLSSGGSIYLTNIIVFGLWYWEFDRGGPVARIKGVDPYPDFLFPQMATEHLAAPGWAPNFIDYMYVSFTNATAFSPTDTMPLTRWAKTLMAVQAGVSLATGALVVARAVNILK